MAASEMGSYCESGAPTSPWRHIMFSVPASRAAVKPSSREALCVSVNAAPYTSTGTPSVSTGTQSISGRVNMCTFCGSFSRA